MSKLALEVSILNQCSNRTVGITWISRDFRSNSFSMQNKITENCYFNNYIGTRLYCRHHEHIFTSLRIVAERRSVDDT